MRKVFVNVLTVSLALDRTNASTPVLKTPPMLMESVNATLDMASLMTPVSNAKMDMLLILKENALFAL